MSGLAIAKFGFNPTDIYGPKYQELFEKIERVSVTQALIDGSRSFLILVEVKWVDQPDMELIRRVFKVGEKRDEGQEEGDPLAVFLQIDELSLEGNRGLYMVRGHHQSHYGEMIELLTTEFYCFMEYPLEYTPGQIIIQIVGRRKDVKNFMDLLSDLGIDLHIFHVRDYHVRGRAIVSELTDRQRDCMKLAVEKGYFDLPRRTDLREMAKKTGITHGSFAFHLRKAQRTIIKALFD